MSAGDLARQAVDRAVARGATTHPLTLGAGAVGLAACGAAAAIGGALAWSIAGAALAGGAAAYCVNRYLRRERFVAEYLRTVQEADERRHLEKLGRIRAALFDLATHDGSRDGAGERAAHALEQYQALHARREAFSAIVVRKLNVGELTYVRYVGAVDRAYEQVIANLSTIVDALQVEAGPEAVEERLEENDAALTALAGAAARLAEMRDLDADPRGRLAHVVEDLERLAPEGAPEPGNGDRAPRPARRSGPPPWNR